MATREEAIAAAKQLEVDGRAFYLDAAEKASSEAAKTMFASLADDEAKHIEWLEKLAPGAASSREANEKLFAKLKDVFAAASAGKAADGASGDIEAIDVAAGMEEKSIAAYSEWVKEGESEDIRRLGAVLVGQERFHRQLLENAKEYLKSPGDWFMQEERWNFEGG